MPFESCMVPKPSRGFPPRNLDDSQGKQHHETLPAGKIQPEIWARQQARAVNEKLQFPFLELVHKIKQPFITAVSDTSASQASFLGGKLLLVGDALTLFRPHVGLATNQGAFHALLLKKVLVGEISIAEWEIQVLEYANLTLLRSIAFGAFFQYGWVSYFLCEVPYRYALVSRWMRSWWNGC